MKSTFKVLFYVKKQSVKRKGTDNGPYHHQWNPSRFQCKKEAFLALWMSKSTARGKSEEAPYTNQNLTISRHKSPGTTSISATTTVCHSQKSITAMSASQRNTIPLSESFREQLESYKEKVGKEKAESTYRGLVADYKNLRFS